MDRVKGRILAVAAALCCAECAFGACEATAFRVGRVWANNAHEAVISISIPLQGFAPEKLICLAGALRHAFPAPREMAYIFSSSEAADGFLPGDLDLPPKVAEYQFKLHGVYVNDEEAHQEYLEFDPDGYREWDPLLQTRIDLPVTGTPVCKLQIDGRCLLEFQHIYYPAPEGETNPSGQVTVRATIRRDGTMSGLAVADAKAVPPERRSFLAAFAMKNLGTWRFEPGRRNDAVRITYYFEAGGVSLPGGQHVEFRLPGSVKVQTNGPR
jgi:hypothetical protein